MSTGFQYAPVSGGPGRCQLFRNVFSSNRIGYNLTLFVLPGMVGRLRFKASRPDRSQTFSRVYRGSYGRFDDNETQSASGDNLSLAVDCPFGGSPYECRLHCGSCLSPSATCPKN
jgi:hypothetical protein